MPGVASIAESLTHQTLLLRSIGQAEATLWGFPARISSVHRKSHTMKPRSRFNCSLRQSLVMLLSSLVWTGNSITLIWTNPSGGNWSDSASWNPVGVPGPGDIAEITTAGNYTVTNDVPATLMGAIIVGNALPATGVQGFLVQAGVTLTTTAPITVYLSLTNNLVPTEPQRFFVFKLP